MIAVEVEPLATGFIFPNVIGSVNAVSVISPLISRISTPNVQSPVCGGVNHMLSSVGMLLPAVVEKVVESVSVLFTNASKVTSIISKKALDVTCNSISTLSSRLSSSRSNVVTEIMSTSAGSVIMPA